MVNPKRINITQVRSTIGALRRHKACVRGLGLRRIRHTVDVEDTPSVRGMVHKASHLVQIVGEFWDFNRLTESERSRIHHLGRALSQMPMAFATPICFADFSQRLDVEKNLNNGTGSLIRVDGKQYCVTAQHVLAGYRERVAGNPKVRFQIGNAQVDPEAVLVDESENLDIAVFDLSGYSAEELAIEGEIPTNFIDVKTWPPQLPELESFVMYGGYPGTRRKSKMLSQWPSNNDVWEQAKP